MKLLDGKELAEFVKERQARQVRALRQAWKVFPKLALVAVGDNPVSDTYMRLKQAYGEDILVEVEIFRVSAQQAVAQLDALAQDDTIHGIVVQLPLPEGLETDEVLAHIPAHKDVDGLASEEVFVSATATAINWLLAGYNVELRGKQIAIVGHGRLVGAPLARMWQVAGLNIAIYDETTSETELTQGLRASQIVVTATGHPRLIRSTMLAPGAVIVDAGVASENGVLVGDVADEVRERGDITITPVRGGVGPLTIAALFDNVIQAARVGLDS